MTSPAKNENLRPHEFRLLLLLAAIQFTNNVDFMVMMPLGPKLMRIFNIGPQSFSWLVSSYSFAGAIAGFFAAAYLDRFDRKKALHFTYTFFIIGTLGCAMAPDFTWLLFFRTFAGLFGGILSAQILAIVGDNIPQSRRGRAMGIVMIAFSAAAVFGIPFCLWMAEMFSWHAPFFFLACLAAVLWIGIQIQVPSQRQHLDGHHRKGLESFVQVLKTKNVPIALVLVPFVMLGFFTMIPLLNPFLVNNVEVPESKITLMYLLGGFATLFTSPLAGKAVDRFGSTKVFTLASVLIAPVLVLISFMTPSTLSIVFAHTTMMFILGNSRMVSSTALITGVVPPRVRGGFMSLVSSFQQVALGIASMVGGFLVTRSESGKLVGYSSAAFVSMSFSLVAILIAWRIPMHKNEEVMEGVASEIL